MGNCDWIEMLYHPLLQTPVLRNCDGERGFPWVGESGKRILSFNGKAFCEAVYEEQDWIRDYAFRFRGITRVRGDRVIMAFFLDEPQIVKTKASQLAAECVETEQVDLPSRYIPIKNYELEENGGGKAAHNGTGMLYPLRKKRDSIINSLTASDAEQQGDVAVNPLIGDIPSHESIAEEMELLLMSM